MSYLQRSTLTLPQQMSVRCPTCHARPAHPCRYVLGSVNGTQVYGAQTPRPHGSRGSAAKVELAKQANRARMSAIAAMRRFDLAEHEQLRDWLKAYGYLLLHTDSPLSRAAERYLAQQRDQEQQALTDPHMGVLG